MIGGLLLKLFLLIEIMKLGQANLLEIITSNNNKTDLQTESFEAEAALAGPHRRRRLIARKNFIYGGVFNEENFHNLKNIMPEIAKPRKEKYGEYVINYRPESDVDNNEENNYNEYEKSTVENKFKYQPHIPHMPTRQNVEASPTVLIINQTPVQPSYQPVHYQQPNHYISSQEGTQYQPIHNNAMQFKPNYNTPLNRASYEAQSPRSDIQSSGNFQPGSYQQPIVPQPQIIPRQLAPVQTDQMAPNQPIIIQRLVPMPSLRTNMIPHTGSILIRAPQTPLRTLNIGYGQVQQQPNSPIEIKQQPQYVLSNNINMAGSGSANTNNTQSEAAETKTILLG